MVDGFSLKVSRPIFYFQLALGLGPNRPTPGGEPYAFPSLQTACNRFA